MRGSQYAEDRWLFIDKIQAWFLHKNYFWLILSILTFGAALVLQIFLTFASGANPYARQESEYLIAPILAVFVLSTFWRSIFHTFLSFTGAIMTYGGVFLFHSTGASTQLVTSFVANRLGYGIRHIVSIPPDSIADRYFIVGICMLAFCLAIAIKPNFFKPKDSDELPYPVWKHSKSFEHVQDSSLVRFIPLSALLSYEEQHFVARYKYVVLIISGTKYLVTPYDWVPEGSVVIRDEKSNSVIGIL